MACATANIVAALGHRLQPFLLFRAISLHLLLTDGLRLMLETNYCPQLDVQLQSSVQVLHLIGKHPCTVRRKSRGRFRDQGVE